MKKLLLVAFLGLSVQQTFGIQSIEKPDASFAALVQKAQQDKQCVPALLTAISLSSCDDMDLLDQPTKDLIVSIIIDNISNIDRKFLNDYSIQYFIQESVDSFFVKLARKAQQDKQCAPALLTTISSYYSILGRISQQTKDLIVSIIVDNILVLGNQPLYDCQVQYFIKQFSDSFFTKLAQKAQQDKQYLPVLFTRINHFSPKTFSQPTKDLIALVIEAYASALPSETLLNTTTLKIILEKYPHKASEFIEPVAREISAIPSTALSILYKYWKPADKERFFNLREGLAQQDKDLLPIGMRNTVQKICHDIGKANKQLMSQTDSHYVHYKKYIKIKLSRDILFDPAIRNFFTAIHKQEQQEIAQGRLTFFHGCKWDWDLKQDIYTALWQTVHKKNLGNYRFLRFERNYYPLTATEQKKESGFRIKTVKEGRTYVGVNVRSQLLFMNHALFGNITDAGSCTALYWRDNSDMSGNQNCLQEVITHLGLPLYYTKYQKEFDQLEALHKAAENRGTLLLISVVPTCADACVYAAQPGGAKSDIGSKLGIDDKVSSIIALLKNDSKKLGTYVDHIEYCIVLTHDMVLNPDYAGKDIKIYPFHMAKPAEYAQYCTLRDELVAKIATDIERNPRI
ncbi:MAG: hypothetical protein WA432_05195 [Candidatus Babeliaceae bacterium]